MQWFYQEGASYIYPDAWEKYLKPIPNEERHDMMKAYYKILTGDDQEARFEAAKAWAIWEASTSKLIQNKKSLHHFDNEKVAEAFARIECHYFTNRGFFDSDTWILDNVSKIKHIPNIIIQGRYDVVCPMKSAWDLHQKWEKSNLIIVPDSGHSMLEKGIQEKLIDYTEQFIKY